VGIKLNIDYEIVDRSVFIVGAGRSGTTLLYNILGCHPDDLPPVFGPVTMLVQLAEFVKHGPRQKQINNKAPNHFPGELLGRRICFPGHIPVFVVQVCESGW
jgi:hypothetical protein